MKKKIIVAFAGTLLIAAFVFSGVSYKPTSLHELQAKASCVCKWEPGSYCPNPDGSVLIDYALEC